MPRILPPFPKRTREGDEVDELLVRIKHTKGEDWTALTYGEAGMLCGYSCSKLKLSRESKLPESEQLFIQKLWNVLDTWEKGSARSAAAQSPEGGEKRKHHYLRRTIYNLQTRLYDRIELEDIEYAEGVLLTIQALPASGPDAQRVAGLLRAGLKDYERHSPQAAAARKAARNASFMAKYGHIVIPVAVFLALGWGYLIYAALRPKPTIITKPPEAPVQATPTPNDGQLPLEDAGRGQDRPQP